MSERVHPSGDPSLHLPRGALEARLDALLPPPRDEGTIELIVRRRADGTRDLPTRARLTVESGLEGDLWAAGRRDPGCQVTAIRADVARVIANGQPVSLFGDNLVVALDLGAANLPPGAMVSIGEALCEVTASPHTGCGLFEGRFGADALAVTLEPSRLPHRLRGVHLRVLRDGAIEVGCRISVVGR